MRQLSEEQLSAMENWMRVNARPIDLAKWEHLFHAHSAEAITAEILPYQNPDGGIGHGFEPDLQYPGSAAIPSAEAVFTAYAYQLDCTAPWFSALLNYFEQTVEDTPKYWLDCPREAMDYPHAPWWQFSPHPAFSPNPCAAAASALIRYGTPAQQNMGIRIARDCLDHLCGTAFCGDHDTLNCMALVEQLIAIDSPLVTDQVMAAVHRRVRENTCFDAGKWTKYFFGPLDFVSSPDSIWHEAVAEGIETHLDFWLETINSDGVWTPNFSWGIDSDTARAVTQAWTGWLAVKRAGILLRFGRIKGRN